MSGLTRSRSGAAIARYTPYNASGRPVASQRTSTHPHLPPNPHLHSPHTLFNQDQYHDHSGPSYVLPTVFSPTHAESGFASHNPPVSFPVSTGGLAASAPQAPSTEVLHIEDVFLAEVQLHYGHYNPFLVIFFILSGEDDRLQHSSPASVVDDLRLRVKSYAQENTSDLRRFRDMIYFASGWHAPVHPVLSPAPVAAPSHLTVVRFRSDLRRLLFHEPPMVQSMKCQWGTCQKPVTTEQKSVSKFRAVLANHLREAHEIGGSPKKRCRWGTSCKRGTIKGNGMTTHILTKDHLDLSQGHCKLCMKSIRSQTFVDHVSTESGCTIAKDPGKLACELRRLNLVLPPGQTMLPTQ